MIEVRPSPKITQIDIDQTLSPETELRNIKRMAIYLLIRDKKTFDHSKRVALFSIKLGQFTQEEEQQQESKEYLPITHQDIKVLGLANLIHDYGKLESDINFLIYQPRKLSPSEMEDVRLHTLYGAQAAIANNIPDAYINIIYQHHNNYDSTGGSIDMLAALTAYVDRFDAAVTRKDKNPVGSSPQEVYQKMVSNIGTELHPRFRKPFERFYQWYTTEYQASISNARQSNSPQNFNNRRLE